MNEAQIYEKLQPIFRDILDQDDLQLRSSLTASDVDDWDSLNHIRLIVAVEGAMAIKFDTADIIGLANVGEFVALIARKLQK